MGLPKGQTNNPNGRPAGKPNKSTALARQAIGKFVDDNAYRLATWLDRIAKDNPAKAFDCFMSVVEYHVPKLSRSETDGVVTHKFEPLVIKQAIDFDNMPKVIDAEVKEEEVKE